MKIKISQIKRWREEIGATHIVVFACDKDGMQHVATHGKSEINAKEAVDAGNNLKTALGWSAKMCNTNPLERICINCTFYDPDYGIHCFNGWSRDGKDGKCLRNSDVRPYTRSKDKCSSFEPKD